MGKDELCSGGSGEGRARGKGCGSGEGGKLIFACSGAADVGEIADRAARKMARDGAGKMFCMAGIGGRVSGIMKATEVAQEVLAIDGCPLDCVKNSLEQAGFSGFKHVRLAEMGMVKGQSPVTDEAIAAAAQAGVDMLG